MKNSTMSSCKFKVGDLVIIPAEWDKEKKYVVLSYTDNTNKFFTKDKRRSCIYKVKRISDNQILEESEEYFEYSE